MAAIQRNTPALLARIEKHRDDLIKRYESLLSLAAVNRTDRNTTATIQYQMQVETTGLIRAAEDLQDLIRQLQEMWLFGHLDTKSDEKLQQATGEKVKEVTELLQQLARTQETKAVTGTT
ncbi:hypothetical protein MBLNU230_g8044t1 [Neophaeotheca triangularis]